MLEGKAARARGQPAAACVGVSSSPRAGTTASRLRLEALLRELREAQSRRPRSSRSTATSGGRGGPPDRASARRPRRCARGPRAARGRWARSRATRATPGRRESGVADRARVEALGHPAPPGRLGRRVVGGRAPEESATSPWRPARRNPSEKNVSAGGHVGVVGLEQRRDEPAAASTSPRARLGDLRPRAASPLRDSESSSSSARRPQGRDEVALATRALYQTLRHRGDLGVLQIRRRRGPRQGALGRAARPPGTGTNSRRRG